MEMSGQHHVPDSLSPEKLPVSFYRRLVGPRSGLDVVRRNTIPFSCGESNLICVNDEILIVCILLFIIKVV
jgi:hypothetical protein